MSIIRAPRPQEKFYILDKKISEDKRLSWAARGLLIFLLGKPDHWKVSIQNLINETAESGAPLGRDGVRKIINDLKAAGYITRIQSKTEGGEFGEVEYQVSESPLTEYPSPVEPSPVNPPQVSTDSKKGLSKAVRNDIGQVPAEPARRDISGKPVKAKRKTPAKSMDHGEAIAILKDKGVEEQVARDWIQTREWNRGIVVPSVIERHEAEAQQAGITLDDALRFMCNTSVFDFTAEMYAEYAE
ncbi:hypothetical protein [Paraburkholderia sp. BCC1876]|uniref:hypothetical protein n=1 Tax=Paraburkholderia sp. BCC1876 TaxID=2676303 RepID=UPI0015906C84|nr:hypothetical protein [Paraburkholderia sp. BCC1876]